MGAAKDDWKMRLLTTFGASILSAAFVLGAYASRSEYKDEELRTRIDNVQVTAKADLEAAKRVYDQRFESDERRLQAVETWARENTALQQEILRKLTILETSSKFQSETLTEVKEQLAEKRKQLTSTR